MVLVILSRLIGESNVVGDDGADNDDDNGDLDGDGEDGEDNDGGDGDGEMDGGDEGERSNEDSRSFLLLIPLSSLPTLTSFVM